MGAGQGKLCGRGRGAGGLPARRSAAAAAQPWPAGSQGHCPQAGGGHPGSPALAPGFCSACQLPASTRARGRVLAKALRQVCVDTYMCVCPSTHARPNTHAHRPGASASLLAGLPGADLDSPASAAVVHSFCRSSLSTYCVPGTRKLDARERSPALGADRRGSQRQERDGQRVGEEGQGQDRREPEGVGGEPAPPHPEAAGAKGLRQALYAEQAGARDLTAGLGCVCMAPPLAPRARGAPLLMSLP